MSFRNDKGSIIAPVILLSLVIAITIGSMLSYFRAPLNLQSRARYKNDLSNLRSVLVMAYSSREGCFAQLPNFGGSKTSLGSVRLESPDKDFAAFIEANGTAGQMKINSVGFKDIRDLNFVFVPTATPKNKSFVATLQIQASDPQGTSLPALLIPFYFMADDAGTLLGCQATSFVDPERNPNLTTEDFLCQAMDTNKTCRGMLPCAYVSKQIYFPELMGGTCITP